MAGKIRVTPQELRTSSRLFKTSSGNTKTMLNKLNAEVNKMSSMWEGEAYKAFFGEYNDLKPSLDKFVKVLDDIGIQLDKVANKMEETDREIASGLRMR